MASGSFDRNPVGLEVPNNRGPGLAASPTLKEAEDRTGAAVAGCRATAKQETINQNQPEKKRRLRGMPAG